MNISDIKAWGKATIDKILLFIALFSLLLSLILLIVMVNRERGKLADLGRKQEQSRNLSQSSRAPDTAFLDDAIEEIQAPLQIPAWSNRLMVAELRVGCVKCGRPIPINAEACPFRNCEAPQPTMHRAGVKDNDLDGMPDDWETKWSLNPNADDASQDEDGDGFANLEEYQAGTSPRDPAAHPDYATKLRVLKIGRVPMPFSFQGVQRLSTNDVRFLLINNRFRRATFAKLGDTVDGYTLVGFEPKKVRVKKVTFEVDEDVSVLTVSKDNKTIPLIINRENQGEMAANLIFLVDQTKMTVKVGDVIKLKNNSYKLVDIKKDAVILADINTGMEITVQSLSASDQQQYPEVNSVKPDNLPDSKP